MATPTYTVPCSACKGEGYIQLSDFINENNFVETPKPFECPDCKGEGTRVIQMTKKEFKERCGMHRYTGRGTPAINGLFFDWQGYHGYKYAVYASSQDISKKDLINAFYDWVLYNRTLPWYVTSKYAETDEKRFKVPISLRGF